MGGGEGVAISESVRDLVYSPGVPCPDLSGV